MELFQLEVVFLHEGLQSLSEVINLHLHFLGDEGVRREGAHGDSLLLRSLSEQIYQGLVDELVGKVLEVRERLFQVQDQGLRVSLGSPQELALNGQLQT
eukprot:CAMPEP_0170552582 /NCGR_PEP_ID=MMETSP0211-20121228/10453_1 /TAXON_ID=311385 /ORGANISM="Pseudokeronopsis sp., Strain OXSARD2" /LENGTH=98 /DNA_ID=CAMNT_0010860375 /DNA_START=1287 /DNA_END=1579 /DNA_ORIENTATION=-